MQAMAIEAVLVGAHQEALPDRGASLEMAEVGRSLAELQPADAGPDGPGADERDMPAALPDALNLIREGLQARGIEPAIVRGQDIGPDLDDDGASERHDFLAYGIEH